MYIKQKVINKIENLFFLCLNPNLDNINIKNSIIGKVKVTNIELINNKIKII